MFKIFLSVVAVVLFPAISSEAAALLPGGTIAPVPGAANSPEASLAGTVLADATFPFATGGIAPVNLSPAQQLVTIAFRDTNAQVPTYLLNRNLDAGATIGAINGLPTASTSSRN